MATRKKKVAKKRGKELDPTVEREDEVEDEDELDDEDIGDLPEPKKKSVGGKVRRVRVVATRMGYDGIRRRREGSTFTVKVRSKADLPKWVMLESEYKAMKAKQAVEEEADSEFLPEEENDEDI